MLRWSSALCFLKATTYPDLLHQMLQLPDTLHATRTCVSAFPRSVSSKISNDFSEPASPSSIKSFRSKAHVLSWCFRCESQTSTQAPGARTGSSHNGHQGIGGLTHLECVKNKLFVLHHLSMCLYAIKQASKRGSE